jgi:hypothetical protein
MMLSALLNELNHGLVIGITFTIVFAALLLVETPRPRKVKSLMSKPEAQVTALEETAVKLMISRVKLALEAAEKKQIATVKSGPLVPDCVSGSSDPIEATLAEEAGNIDEGKLRGRINFRGPNVLKTAKLLRAQLKELFPEIRWTVTGKRSRSTLSEGCHAWIDIAGQVGRNARHRDYQATQSRDDQRPRNPRPRAVRQASVARSTVKSAARPR